MKKKMRKNEITSNAKCKKLLVVIPYFVPAYSYWWPLKVAYDYAIQLIKRWYDITVATTDALDKDNRIKKLEETIDWIKIVRFRNVSNYLAKFHNIYLPIGMKKWIKNNITNYDTVHMHDFFTYLNVITWVYCRKNSIPYIVQPHGSANFLPERWKSFIKKLFFKLFWTKLFDWSKSIIAVSQYEKNNIYYENKDKIEIIYNWIDTDKIKEFEQSITRKDIENFKDKFWLKWKKIIFSMWRLHSVKRFDKLIDWSKDILKKNKNYCVVISWPDEWEMEKLKQQIKDNWLEWSVVLTWGLYWKDKYIAYWIANIFTLLSDSEAGSVTLVDAVYYNLPLILSPGCNFEFKNEYVKIVENKSDFENNVLDLIDKKAKYSFWKEFDMNYLISKLENIYDK